MSTILLVEDSPTQSLQMRMLLESGSHTVECAGDGSEALELLADGRCDLVVTDLEMPVMNGLQLVDRMRVNFPHIPAVLVTARGSERLAAQALRHGAAGYVPKSMLEDLLLPTVDDVLELMRTDQSYARLIDYMTENRLVFELPNRPEMFMPAIDLTLRMAVGVEVIEESDRPRMAMAIKHALENAMYRGNLELSYADWHGAHPDDPNRGNKNPSLVQERMTTHPFKLRKIHYDARIVRDLLRVVIRDNGHGFNTKILPKPGNTAGLGGEFGRGLVVISSVMDKVSYNDQGNEVTLLKYRPQVSS